MQGYRTIIFNVLIAALAAGLEVVAGIPWSTVVDPTMGMIIVAGANMALRAITTTPLGKSALEAADEARRAAALRDADPQRLRDPDPYRRE